RFAQFKQDRKESRDAAEQSDCNRPKPLGGWNVSTPAELLTEFRHQLDKQLQDFYGKRASGADAQPPTTDDAHLAAFGKAASVYYHDRGDQCAQLRAAANAAEQKYQGLLDEQDRYKPHKEYDPENHQFTIVQEKNKPAALDQQVDDAKKDWQQKKQ